MAEYLNVTQGRIGRASPAAQERWKRDTVVTSLRSELTEAVTRNGGVVAVEELAAAVLLSRGSVEDDPLRSCLAMAAVRGDGSRADDGRAPLGSSP